MDSIDIPALGRAPSPSAPPGRLRTGHEPPAGAHLVTPRGLYTHHGIYVGHGRVIHYAGAVRHPPQGLIEEISLAEFSAGRGVWIRFAPAHAVVAAPAIQRALSRLGERRYRLLWNNCEHFCDWCLHGWRDPAVQSWGRRTRLLARNVAATVGFAMAQVRAAALTRGRAAWRRVAAVAPAYPDRIRTVS
jgi:hypothetical protein